MKRLKKQGTSIKLPRNVRAERCVLFMHGVVGPINEKQGHEAGGAYAKCAETQIKMKETSRAAQFYQTAAEAFRKVSPTEAVGYFQSAIAMLCDAGRFSTAAKLQKEIGAIYEEEENYEEAIMSYRQAADYFSGENQTSSANNMLLKVAQFSAQLEHYEEAMGIYEEVAKTCMDSNLLKFNAKGHLLNAGICCLATEDQVLIKQKSELYDDIDYAFADSREGKLFHVRLRFNTRTRDVILRACF